MANWRCSTNNYAGVEPVAQLQLSNGSLGYRSCLIVHSDSDLFSPEDLAGRTFAFNDPNSTSGYLVPSAFFLMEMGVDPKKHFSKLTFSGSHEASILAVANKKVESASTNLPDLQQLTREGKVPRGGLRVIWVSKLIPNDPIVVRKDLPPSLRSAIQESLTTMRARNPEAFKEAGAIARGLRPRRRRQVPGHPRPERDGQAARGPEVARGGAAAARRLALCLGAVLAVAVVNPRPRCKVCKTRTEAEEAEADGSVPPVVMITYRCPRCREIAFRRPIVVWD